jgi:hypothetical protein
LIFTNSGWCYDSIHVNGHCSAKIKCSNNWVNKIKIKCKSHLGIIVGSVVGPILGISLIIGAIIAFIKIRKSKSKSKQSKEKLLQLDEIPLKPENYYARINFFFF